MKKGDRTVFLNAWIQRNKHFHWKNNSFFYAYKFKRKGTEPSSKMPEAKKLNTLLENTVLFEKSL